MEAGAKVSCRHTAWRRFSKDCASCLRRLSRFLYSLSFVIMTVKWALSVMVSRVSSFWNVLLGCAVWRDWNACQDGLWSKKKKKGLCYTHVRISELFIRALEEVLNFAIALDVSDNVVGLPLFKRVDAVFYEADNKIRWCSLKYSGRGTFGYLSTALHGPECRQWDAEIGQIIFLARGLRRSLLTEYIIVRPKLGCLISTLPWVRPCISWTILLT